MLRLIPFECNECTYCGARKDKEISVRVRRMVEYSFLSFANFNKKQEGLKSFLANLSCYIKYSSENRTSDFQKYLSPDFSVPEIWMNSFLIGTHIIHLKTNFFGRFYLLRSWLDSLIESKVVVVNHFISTFLKLPKTFIMNIERY